MTIIQCKFCNKPFHSIGGSVCPGCLDQIDRDFFIIRDYLYDNPGSFDIDAICEATKVSKKFALHLLAEKRLNISLPDGAEGALDGNLCSICHKPINYGKICEDCRISLSSKLSTSPVRSSAPAQAPDKKDAYQKIKGKVQIRGRS